MITARWNTDELRRAAENARSLGVEMADAKVIGPAVLRIGKELHEDIVRTAPRDQTAPHMADDFVAKVSSESREQGQTVVLVGPRPPRSAASNGAGWRAPLIEYGTSRQAPRSFIRPAYDRLRVTYAAELAAGLRDTFARVVRRYGRRVR